MLDLRLECSKGALLEVILGQSLVAELEPRAIQAAHHTALPCQQMGPRVALAIPADWRWRGRPFWIRLPLGWALSPMDWNKAGAGGGRASGRRAGLSFVRGFARLGRYSTRPLRGRGFPFGPGARWAWASETSGWRLGSLGPNPAEAPPSAARPPIISAVSSDRSFSPATPPVGPAPSAPWLSAPRAPLLLGGLPGRGGGGAGRERRAARQPSTSSER